MAPASAGSLIVTGIAAKRLVEGVVSDLYGLAKQEAGFQLKKWKAKHHAETVAKRIRQLRLVKTIWQIEKEIDLTSFYHPSKVRVDDKAAIVHRLADLKFDGNVVIEGTVGQGKSIFLRYLASVEFCVTRRIPVFIELRRLRQGQSLIGLALQELKALGFEMNEDVFGFFAKKGRLLLLLDAFDEVKEELRQDLISELEVLIRQNEALRVVVTSRPQSGVAASPFLRVFRLCPLEGREYEEVVRKMAHSQDTANAIIAGIKKEAAHMYRLLTTPLMVALLMIRYKIDQSLPQNASAFYGSLFPLLLQRHDKTKGGYVRPRKSELGDMALQEFFNALCFVTRKADEASFSRDQLYTHARSALEVLGQTGDTENILTDIIEITCLIITDGEECRFIHKSVQEYHAALLIKEQPDDSAILFYHAMRSKWQNWQEELGFLSLIDRYRYLKHFYIDQLYQVLGSHVPTGDSISNEFMIDMCGSDNFTITHKDGFVKNFGLESTERSWPTSRLNIVSGYLIDLLRLTPEDLSGIVSSEAKDDEKKTHSVKQLLGVASCQHKVAEACTRLCRGLIVELRESEQYVANVESRKAVFQI